MDIKWPSNTIKPQIVYKLEDEDKGFEALVYEMPEPTQHIFLYQIDSVLVDFWFDDSKLNITTDLNYLKLNNKQREAVLANVLDVFEDFRGMVQSEVVLHNIRSTIKARVMYLSQREIIPGDFGQEE